MVIIYTGNGKGKTSACVGQAVRALGNGMDVAFAQFMKRDGQAGEQRFLARLLGTRFFAAGQGFLRQETERPQHREAAVRTLEWARDALSAVDMLLLDESLYALTADILKRKELEDLLAAACDKHLVLSGRNAPNWLIERSDIVTEMNEIKHPWHSGAKAARGIEF
ncbi:MAG: cob(I)alamin adenosyltransferase [Candidatus Desulfovibrio kirbyi]|uniref:corrinoid adenosyltransferase n=1 Tax=Candidatus Desulfovibrio kirbyi TaxID=2696086 RepID=A0A6L2R785_9BACT|nr:MAG: cob(I)alamin adenosyltransferase [Candidatus Desulfovibrio kirbyi]